MFASRSIAPCRTNGVAYGDPRPNPELPGTASRQLADRAFREGSSAPQRHRRGEEAWACGNMSALPRRVFERFKRHGLSIAYVRRNQCHRVARSRENLSFATFRGASRTCLNLPG